ncbi:hypothetical protein [Sinorhizobium fredii]|uniref:hypothetical protein n=1 Tax=Rhizobium fredii TaxID=380 RepID=UPI0004AF5604|nr:hypothetical protein [Sinorhizobium fredii]AWM24860.1 hypothetical protein AOX55_00001600 [Sinorhizobium fredii CCBAU 25509]
MNVEIFLENEGVIPKGFDWTELEQGIQRNIESFVEATEGKVVEVNRKSPPNAAQGEDQIIQWLIEVATNPKMAIVYYRMVCFALNELINASRKKSEEEAEKEGIRVRLKLLGKEIQLPAAVTSIEEFLKSISE